MFPFVLQTKYRQNVSDLKFTSVEDTPEMIQAKVSNKLATDVSVSFVEEATAACCSHLMRALHASSQRLYREEGENLKHSYTLSGDLPEMVQAKLNARNLSEVKGASSLFVRCGFHIKPGFFICFWAISEHIQGILDEDP